MNRPTLITLIASTAVCGTVLVAQALQNRDLAGRVEETRREVSRLETKLKNPGRPSGGSTGPRARDGDATSSMADPEKVARARNTIASIMADADADSPGSMLKVVPQLLHYAEKLSASELLELAAGMDPRLHAGGSEFITRGICVMLAAERNPHLASQHATLMQDPAIRRNVLRRLAEQDPEAARSWLDQSRLAAGEKTELISEIGFGVLRQDVAGGLQLIRRSLGTANTEQSHRWRLPVPPDLLPDLVVAYHDPVNADLRTQVGQLILRTNMEAGGAAAARSAAETLRMSPEEVGTFLTTEASLSLAEDPETAIAWILAAQDEDETKKNVPVVISQWTRRDFNAAGEFLDKMEPSGTKDLAIREFVEQVIPLDPEGAAAWSLSIGDEPLRQESLRTVIRQWNRLDPQAAQRWLER